MSLHVLQEFGRRMRGLVSPGHGRGAAVSGTVSQRASSALYKLYRLSYATGRAAGRVSLAVFAGAASLWRFALSDLIGRAGGLLLTLSEFKRSRQGRGEYSVARAAARIVRNTAGVFAAAGRAFASGGPAEGLTVFGRLSAASVSRFWSRNKRRLNYAAPVLGAAVLAFTIFAWSHYTFALSVSYNGRPLGLIVNEQEFREAVYQVETNVSNASGHNFTMTKAPEFQMVIARKSDMTEENDLYNNIISASSSRVFKGYGLYVDKRLIGASADGAAVQSMLTAMLSPYENDPQAVKVDFAQDVQVRKGVFPTSILKSVGSMQSVLNADVEGRQSYTAQKGDSPLKVASMYHLSLDQLYAMNPALAGDQMVQGQTVLVKNARQYLTVKVIKNEIYNQDVPYGVENTPSDQLYQGESKVQVAGLNGVQQVVASVSYVNGAEVGRNILSSSVVREPVTQQVLVGTKAKPSPSAGSVGGSAVPLSASGSARAGGIVSYAESCLGTDYVSGGASRSGFDCSGFTMYVFRQFGVSLAHSAMIQSGQGRAVGRNGLQSGDLVFFDTNGGHNSVSHVGIYIGGGRFIQAASRNPSAVTVSSLSESYYSSRYMGARRVLN